MTGSCCIFLALPDVVMETSVVILVLARTLCFVNIDTPVFDLLCACQQLTSLRASQNLESGY